MKLINLLLIIMAAVLIAFGLSGNALAFHDAGVAYCEGCHTMHNSQDGLPMANSAGGYLLQQVDGSSACLRCHGGYGQLTDDGSGFGSGGDFYWLTKTFTWSAHGHASSSTGDSHGHNIIAADFGLAQTDLKLNVAPGGTYPASELSCASCHDPHGRQGNELLLWGAGQIPGGYSFTNPAPILASAGRRTTGSSAVSDSNHTAFGSGMSAWCANCHTTFDDGLAAHMHPVNQTLGSTIADNYNGYVSTDDPMSGIKAGAYWEIVPFETGETDELALEEATTSTEGPDSGSRVMCLSCHRAHASAFQDIGRWDFRAELMVDSHPQVTDGGVSGLDVDYSYYTLDIATDFGETQRSFCNKCHKNDG